MTAIRRRILLVEDEPNLRRTVKDMLTNEGYTVETSGDGLEGQKMAMSEPYDLVVLDVMLPSRSGFDVCRHLRQNHIEVPILMLTARTELNNKIQGFTAGADDYLTKPFDAAELQVRIAALFRRAPNAARARLKSYDFGGIHVDFVRTKLTKGDRPINLSDRESRLLQYLIAYKGEPVSRDELLQQVWGYSATPLTRTVDVHIAWLRQKIEDDPANPKYILTVHGQGYRFVD
jgi:two-component system alkaline phosphatase synthesis response regulator PhoP